MKYEKNNKNIMDKIIVFIILILKNFLILFYKYLEDIYKG